MNPVPSSRREDVLQPHAGPESSLLGLMQLVIHCEAEQRDEKNGLILHFQSVKAAQM